MPAVSFSWRLERARATGCRSLDDAALGQIEQLFIRQA
jgi:hypothetical protein